MDEKKLKEAVSTLRESKKRNFNQTVDFVVSLKNLDLKKVEHQVEFFIELPKPKGKKTKVCALIGPELAESAKGVMDKVIMQSEFEEYQRNKKLAKKLATEMDYFVAQANIMPKVAGAFGRVFGPRGKMPNPKAGCIVPPNANLEQIYNKLQITVKLSGKKAPIVQTIVGNQESSDKDLMENIKYVFNNLVHHLPQGENNVKGAYIKFTMGKSIRVI